MLVVGAHLLIQTLVQVALILPPPSFQQWTTFFVDEYSDETLDYEIEQNTFDQGNLYFKVEETTGWDESNTFSLTENGLYDTGNMHPKYGQMNLNFLRLIRSIKCRD